MYTIKKAAHIVDELRIEDDGKVLDLNINIYVDDILENFEVNRAAMGEAHRRLMELRAATDADPGQIAAASESLNRAAVSLFEMIFGAEDTQRLVDFYDGRVLTLLGDMMPYITGVILPEIKRAQQDLAKTYTSWAG